jgi:hypothetical protein
VSTSDNLNAKKGGNMASLTPAYGRDYKNQKAALADWYAGKDFILHEMLSEGLVNIDDCPPGNHQLRYDRMQKVIMVNPAKRPKVKEEVKSVSESVNLMLKDNFWSNPEKVLGKLNSSNYDGDF